MNSENVSHLAPSRIGQILDRALALMPKLLSKNLLFAFTIISSIAAFQIYLSQELGMDSAASGRATFMEVMTSAVGTLMLGFLVSFLELYLSVWVVYRSADIWLGRDLPLASPPPGALSMTLRLAVLNITIVAITGFYFSILAGPAVLMFVVPGGLIGGMLAVALGTTAALIALAYLLNRTLASYILMLENLTIKEALSRSKSLMTFYPNMNWYSFGTPVMRLSGILLVTTTLGTIPALVFGASSSFTSFQFGSSLLSGAALLLVFFARFFILVFSAFSTLSLVAFYYDVRARSEAFDILHQLSRISNRAKAANAARV